MLGRVRRSLLHLWHLHLLLHLLHVSNLMGRRLRHLRLGLRHGQKSASWYRGFLEVVDGCKSNVAAEG
jgi:hypothetical protein